MVQGIDELILSAVEGHLGKEALLNILRKKLVGKSIRELGSPEFIYINQVENEENQLYLLVDRYDSAGHYIDKNRISIARMRGRIYEGWDCKKGIYVPIDFNESNTPEQSQPKCTGEHLVVTDTGKITDLNHPKVKDRTYVINEDGRPTSIKS